MCAEHFHPDLIPEGAPEPAEWQKKLLARCFVLGSTVGNAVFLQPDGQYNFRMEYDTAPLATLNTEILKPGHEAELEAEVAKWQGKISKLPQPAHYVEHAERYENAINCDRVVDLVRIAFEQNAEQITKQPLLADMDGATDLVSAIAAIGGTDVFWNMLAEPENARLRAELRQFEIEQDIQDSAFGFDDGSAHRAARIRALAHSAVPAGHAADLYQRMADNNHDWRMVEYYHLGQGATVDEKLADGKPRYVPFLAGAMQADYAAECAHSLLPESVDVALTRTLFTLVARDAAEASFLADFTQANFYIGRPGESIEHMFSNKMYASPDEVPGGLFMPRQKAIVIGGQNVLTTQLATAAEESTGHATDYLAKGTYREEYISMELDPKLLLEDFKQLKHLKALAAQITDTPLDASGFDPKDVALLERISAAIEKLSPNAPLKLGAKGNDLRVSVNTLATELLEAIELPHAIYNDITAPEKTNDETAIRLRNTEHYSKTVALCSYLYAPDGNGREDAYKLLEAMLPPGEDHVTGRRNLTSLLRDSHEELDARIKPAEAAKGQAFLEHMVEHCMSTGVASFAAYSVNGVIRDTAPAALKDWSERMREAKSARAHAINVAAAAAQEHGL